ncbi:MAG TPA: isochorismatase family cysteine hydrolase [Acidobacteriaceae bacterium]|jgi:nicotinamidase-related amidase|nr:isochorismatase family cysteine hydrolase [Acidobacteriaceae bacterium]
MEALIVVDAQNEFSSGGLRPVPNHEDAVRNILSLVEKARRERRPIAWVRHYNKPNESKAFLPSAWGSEFSPGLGPVEGFGSERVFEKDVFGAFTGTSLEEWLRAERVDAVLIAGFYTHMCLSTSVREALVRGFGVSVDPKATGACGLSHALLGAQSADEVRRSALLQVAAMGATILGSL